MEDTAKVEANVEVPAKFKSIVDSVESMSVIDLNELVKLLEKKFGVSATAVAAPPVKKRRHLTLNLKKQERIRSPLSKR